MNVSDTQYAAMRERAVRALYRWRNLHDRPQMSSLVDQAFIRMVESDPKVVDGEHLLAMWTRAMRWELVDFARSQKARKRGGDRRRVELDEERFVVETDLDEMIDVHDALERFAEVSPRDAKVVEYRYFGDLTWPEVAEILGGTASDWSNRWRFIRADLKRIMISLRDEADGAAGS